MKDRKLKLLLVNGLIALFVMATVSAPISAQSNLQIAVTIPFDFIVGNERLPAGDYAVGTNRRADGVLIVRSNDEGTALMSLTQSARSVTPKEQTLLRFRRYGDTYFLYQVWVKGEKSGYELPKSRTERLIERDLAQNGRDDMKRAEIVTISVF